MTTGMTGRDALNGEIVRAEPGYRIAQSAFISARLAADATTFALANGRLGVRGAVEELGDHHASFLAGVHVRQPLSYHESFPGFAEGSDTRLTGPAITRMTVDIDGAPVDFINAAIHRFERELDVRAGLLRRVTRWGLGGGRSLEIVAERIVPIGGDPLCAARISVTPTGFAPRLGLGFPLGESDQPRPAQGDPRISARGHAALASTHALGRALRANFVAQGGDARTLHVEQRLHGESSADRVERVLADGETLMVDRFVALAAGDEQAPTAMLEAAEAMGFDKLRQQQADVCAQFWRDADIAIDGDDDLTRALRFNLFHVFQSASRDGDVSVAAKGLTGEGYEGQYFWDTETFVLPLLAQTRPELARNILTYRIAKLDDARAHATAIGHRRGALYPWRTIGGRESSAHYPTGSAQYHINAAIAQAFETYVAATGDETILADGGAELIFETARLWIDIGHFSERRGGAFLVHGVTGPDEYSALVDNDFYTNATAQRHLRHAARLARTRGGVDAREIVAWERAAELMWLPLDRALGVHPQDDGFLDKPLLPEELRQDRQGPLLLHMHPMQLFRHRLCKQGDVIQAYASGALVASRAQMRRDFAYYEPLTTHDSTLSAAAFAIVAARAGLEDKALRYLAETAFVDLENRHGNSDHGVHMAAMAGSWLALVQGWAGMRTDRDIPAFAPACPAAWNAYRFTASWNGSRFETAVDRHGTQYRLIDGPVFDLEDHGRPLTITRAGVTIARPQIEAVIFDLDGVLTDTAEAHFAAWNRLCVEERIPFDREINERLKGVDRAGSLRLILDAAGLQIDEACFDDWLRRKNGFYRDSIADFTPAHLFPGVRALLEDCLTAGLQLGLASASRNAAELVERLGIAGLFDHIADASAVARGKPAPDIFLATAAAMGVAPERCIGVEDAAAGIVAIRAAGMRAIGVGDPAVLSGAEHIVSATSQLTVAQLLRHQPENEMTIA